MAILVCPLSQVHHVAKRRAPCRLISLLDPMSAFPSLEGFDQTMHLRVPMHDIAEEMLGWHAPTARQIDELIDFITPWDRAAPLLVHCYAGISRSTATAFIVACAHNPSADEEEIAWALRRASASASPNPRMVALADSALGRGGRMRRAAEAIGRGQSWEEIGEAVPFEIPSLFRGAF